MIKLIVSVCFLTIINLFAFEPIGKVLICGPEKYDLDEYTSDDYKFYFITYGKNNEYIVYNDKYQYPSTFKQTYEMIYNQNGGTFYSSVENDGNIMKVTLYIENYKTSDNFPDFQRVFKINMKDKTYTMKNTNPNMKNEPDTIGVCVTDTF